MRCVIATDASREHGIQQRRWFGGRVREQSKSIGRHDMATWQPDPTFYPSPRQAAKAPAEGIAYVAAFDPARKSPDGISVVDVDPKSSSYSKILGTVSVPNTG